MVEGHTHENQTRIQKLVFLTFSLENSERNRLEIKKIQEGICSDENLKEKLNRYQLKPIVWGYVDKDEKFIFCPNSSVSTVPVNATQITLVLVSEISVNSDVVLVTTHKFIEFFEKT